MNPIIIILLVVLFILLFVFIIRSKIMFALSAMLPISFILLFIVALIGLFFAKPFVLMSEYTYQQAGILETIQEIDDKFSVDYITEEAEDTIDGIIDWIKGDDEEQEIDSPSENDSNEPGVLETGLYPKLVGMLAYIYRILITALAFVGLAVIIYLSYITQSIGEQRKINGKYKKLENRVKELEKQLGPNLNQSK